MSARQSGTRKWRPWWLLWLVLLIPLGYFVVQVAIIMMPRMRTQIAVQDTMTESIEAKGFVALQTTPVGAGSGTVYYTVPVGQRVSAGSEVALLFSSPAGADAMAALSAVRDELALLEAAQNTYVEGGDIDSHRKQIQTGLYGVLDVVESGRYDGLDAAAGELAFASNRMQVVTGDNVRFDEQMAALQAQQERLEALAVPTGGVAAPETGFFVPLARGSGVRPDRDSLVAMGPAALATAMEGPQATYGEDVAGCVVTDYKWSFFTVIPLEQAERLAEGDKLEISFPDVGKETMPVVIVSIQPDEQAGLAKVEAQCEYMSAQVMQLGVERAEIILRTEKGIRVDKQAMRIIEGQRCVYVKFGNQVFLRPIKILLEDDNYLLLPGEKIEGVNEVELYDEVVVDPGGVELHDKKVL